MKVQTYKLANSAGSTGRWRLLPGDRIEQKYAGGPWQRIGIGSDVLIRALDRGELIPAEVVEVADEPSNTYAGIDRSKPDEWGVGLPSRAKPIQDAAAAHEQTVTIDRSKPVVWTGTGPAIDPSSIPREQVAQKWKWYYVAGKPVQVGTCPSRNPPDSISALELRVNQVQNVSPFAASVARCDKEAMR